MWKLYCTRTWRISIFLLLLIVLWFTFCEKHLVNFGGGGKNVEVYQNKDRVIAKTRSSGCHLARKKDSATLELADEKRANKIGKRKKMMLGLRI